ncbi:hypothetical protein [Streptomyces sp. NPDC007205]|uniref:hypothetical protein n=1 Tax=Streptomyces sp. NPDC007205 TaxID=3154316 RepID=UPI0033CD1B5F
MHLKAAALLQILARVPCLEHSGESFARHVNGASLILNGHQLDYPSKAAAGPVRDAVPGALGVVRIARRPSDFTIG